MRTTLGLEVDGAHRLAALERRCRWLTGALLVLLLLMSAATLVALRPADATAPQAGPLTLRELVVVDANGTPRVRIAAPLPDPIMLGKRFRRGGAVSGILLYDAEGNERGGYVTGDESRDAALTLDEINRAAIHIGVADRGESHVTLSNGQGGFAAMGMTPAGGYLRLEQDGRNVTSLPAAPAKAGDK